ncbi:MAG TPA: Hsp20/alpha crystallin family protein [Egibacteraceae bacterium]|nr:Hsp20/alpha crystallin family protein [Actinomycetota bacterium]HWB72678.1 Hsp20/alpha crystallin family protein [Egibacteraceae bacterium]
MAVIRWDPWGELAALQRDVAELFGRTSGQAAPRTGGLVPPIDAFRTDEGLVVRVDLPGLRPDQVDISFQDGMLTISGERRFDTEVKEENWLRQERPVGVFERGFSLAEGTDPGAITANFENGVLELRVPHPPERKPHRIQVTAASGDAPGGQTVDVGGQT